MNQRNEKLEALFEAALGLESVTERQSYLHRVCPDTELLREVESLLEAHANPDSLLAGEAKESVGTIQIQPLTETPGTVIDKYKLLEKLGEGGFGVVYMAEQREPVKRRVALKIIKIGMDTREVVARFEAERQALALMDHPNIAKIFDAGVTSAVVAQASPLASCGGVSPPGPTPGETPGQPAGGDACATLSAGRPYFVMELVRGIKITDYCDEKKLSTRERLDLFIKVCQAVQHAHQKGIIHRDLKPSNILVTVNDGVAVPKIIDFGIAKATQAELTGKTLFTRFHQFLGTPAYMSPEQAEMTSLDIDTRSDIYSLGVLLYELLTGKTPFDAEELLKAGLDEMRRTIREKEPERPSTRLARSRDPKSAATLATRHSSLATDLDWIVMKCLEKDRTRRYDTANSLATDIQHYLRNEPVVARPPTAVYRFQKLVRRNNLAFTAGVAVALVLLVGIAVSWWQAVLATRERERANQRLDAALVFVDKVFNKVAPEIQNLAGAATAQETLGQAGLEFVQRLREGPGDDPALRVALARLLLQVSKGQNPGNANTVGNYETGLKRAEQAIELVATQLPQVSKAERLELLWWAKFSVTQCLSGLDRWEEVVAHSEEMEPLLNQLEQFPDRARWTRRQRMCIRSNAGSATMKAGRPKEAIERYFLPILQSDWARSITNTSTGDTLDGMHGDELEVVMNTHDNVASAYGLLKQFDAMIPPAEESVRIAELLVRRFPGNARYAVGRAECCAQQGYAMVRTGRIDEGLAALKRGREEIEGLVSKDIANDLFLRNRALIAAFQASAFAGWSVETTTPAPERRQRLAQAETYLAEAEQFSRTAKSNQAEPYLEAARAEVAAAKAKLEADVSAQPKP